MRKPGYFRILVIDDNPAIHEDFRKILIAPDHTRDGGTLASLEASLFGDEQSEKNDFSGLPNINIDSAFQGEEGLRLVQKAKEENMPYALAFVDVRMPPGWDGVETIQHIWQVDPEIQVVICTAHSDYSWNDITRKLGSTDRLLILKKPFDNVEVRQLASTLTEKWKLTQKVKRQLDELQISVEQRTSELFEALSIARSTLESTNDGILVVDKNNKVTIYNQRYLELWQMPQEIIDHDDGFSRIEFVLPQLENPHEFVQRIKQVVADEEMITTDEVRFKDGRVFERYSQPHKLNGETIGRVWSFRDVTERKRMEQQLTHQATHDALTNLPNRTLLRDRVEQLILQNKRNRKMFALIFFDLDRFKNINDNFGHNFGDLLLQNVAKRIRESLRESDTIARMGGDEFVVVMNGLEKEEDCISMVQKLLNALAAPMNIQGREITVMGSLGISIYPKNGDDVDTLLKKADAAMYTAKENHPGSFYFYSEDLNTRSIKRFEIESNLFRALEKQEFVLQYQPIYETKYGRIVGAEALIRWQHPKLGLVPPQEFIPLAEEIGLIVPIGEWVVKNACQQAKDWHDQGFDNLYISVNISGNQLKQHNVVDAIKNTLEQTQLDARFLEFELTETSILEQIQHVSDAILILRSLGIKIVIDDFGTGYSSLTYLKRFPIDKLKIDRSFINFLSTDPDDVAIVVATIAMAHNLGIKVVAEGVETLEQLNFLKQYKCDFIQGFYFSRPIDATSFLRLLQQQEKVVPIRTEFNET